MRLRGGRTGVRAITCDGLELTGLMQPFDTEIFYGERVGVLGANGAGKSHFLRLLGGDAGRAHRELEARRARRPGPVRADARPPGVDATARWSTCCGRAATTGAASTAAGRWASLRRYGLNQQGDQSFGTLSGGQQARFQILLLELSGATLLLLDEPTDNLDVISAEALEEALEAFEGTVLAVDARPLVRALDGPVPRVRRRRHGVRVERAGVRRDARRAPALTLISRARPRASDRSPARRTRRCCRGSCRWTRRTRRRR